MTAEKSNRSGSGRFELPWNLRCGNCIEPVDDYILYAGEICCAKCGNPCLCFGRVWGERTSAHVRVAERGAGVRA